ncbi:MAG TPA: HAMP domain-containing sensor histidine kinase [Terriglobales bacterium]|nr:HAMP domain-containing sensor histidine kinase [Terriglobales bacterium]
MKFRQHWNERTRMLLMLELAVALPAAALIIASVLHLQHIQREGAVEAAIQRDFSQVLVISEKEINAKAYDLVDDVRDQLPARNDACNIMLDKILTSHPYAAHIYMYDPKHGFIFRSQPSRLQDASFEKEASGLSKMIGTWMAASYDDFEKELKMSDKKGKHYYFESNWVARDDKHVYQSIAHFLVTDPKTGDGAIAGMVFDAEYLRDQFFPDALDSVMSHNSSEPQGVRNRPVLMIHAKSDSHPLVASAGWDGGEPEVERNMEGAFPGLTLAMKMRGTTLAAMGAHFAHTSFLILGGLSLLLAGGIFLTYHNVSKEMALARLKSDFVSNVSHELRTPLALIRLYAETLELGRLNSQDKCHEYYQIIRKESERLTALINNILDFSRIEAGRKEYDFRETDLSELVRNTLESYRYQIEQHGFSFEEKINPVPALRVDREAMARSLVNLVNNALKYSQDRKYIGVNLYREDGSIKLEVIDHGIGIPEEEQNKIFEKFYRVGDPLVHNTKGSGLGLSLVRHIVQAHRGIVRVDSTPGQGSKFTIALPIELGEPKLAEGMA